MRNLVRYVFVLLLISGCAPSRAEKTAPLTAESAKAIFYAVIGDATNPDNWQNLDSPMEAVFCAQETEGCSSGKVYAITKYLPQSYLGEDYRCVIFRDDTGEESIFYVGNLPNQKDASRIEKELRKIDP